MDWPSADQPSKPALTFSPGVRSRVVPSTSRTYRWSSSLPPWSALYSTRASFGNQEMANVESVVDVVRGSAAPSRSEEHTSELQSLMRISYAVFCLKKKIQEIN